MMPELDLARSSAAASLASRANAGLERRLDRLRRHAVVNAHAYHERCHLELEAIERDPSATPG
jgi:hypothetical protein